jgi:CTP-dependent riboflavin kinase
MDRVLLAEVASFAENGKACFMTNSKLAEALGISEDRTRKIIYRLIQSGHLNRGVVANGHVLINLLNKLLKHYKTKGKFCLWFFHGRQKPSQPHGPSG